MFQNRVNGKAYIGKSMNLESRHTHHMSLLRKNKDSCLKINRAWRKYGEENFEYRILCYCDEAELDKMERIFIKVYNSHAHGYNCTDGGGGISGYRHTEATKEYIRMLSTGRKHTDDSRKHMSDVQRGRKLTDKHKRALSAAWTAERRESFIRSRSGANNPNYGRCGANACVNKPVVCSTGEFFWSAREAAEWCGLRSYGNLSSCINGNRPYCGRHPDTNERLSWRRATVDEIQEMTA